MKHSARINVRVLVVVVAVFALGGAALVGTHYARKSAIARDALAKGNAAFEQQRWAEAAKQYRRYISKDPDSLEVIQRCAAALLADRPMTPENVGVVIQLYRRALRLAPTDEAATVALAKLYTGLGDHDELLYLGRRYRELAPDDPRGSLWIGRAQIAGRQFAEAAATLKEQVAQQRTHGALDDSFVEAATLLSYLALEDAPVAEPPDAPGPAAPPGPIDDERQRVSLAWLDLAVSALPDAAEPRISRAHFYRVMAQFVADDGRAVWLAAMRADLEQAEGRADRDPFAWGALAEEWRALGDYERAERAINQLAETDRARLAVRLVNPDDWDARMFMLAAQIELEQGPTPKSAGKADFALGLLTRAEHPAQRQMILPDAIKLYVTCGRVDDARRCLDEFSQHLPPGDQSPQTAEKLALLRGLIAAATRQPYDVIATLEPAVARFTGNARLWQLLADAYGQTSQPQRAAEALKRYAELAGQDFERPRVRPGQPLDQLVALLELRIQSASDAALAELERQIHELQQQAPDEAVVRVLSASLALRRGQNEAAEKILREAIDAAQNPLAAEVRLALLLAARQKFADAATILERSVNRDPDAVVAWQTLAKLQQEAGQVAEARQTFERALAAVTPEPARTRPLERARAVFELAHGDRAAGLAALTAIAAADANEVPARSLLLDQPEVRGDANRRVKLLEELRTAERDTGLLWRVHTARLWLESADWRQRSREIEQLLTHCISADRRWSIPVLMLGELQQRQGQIEQAEQTYRQGLADRPGAPELAGPLMDVLEKRGRPGDALALFESLERPTALAARAVRCALAGGQPQTAIDLLTAACNADPADFERRLQLARLIYGQRKDRTAALKWLAQAEALRPADVNALALRAYILSADGKGDEALALLDAAVQRDPSFEHRAARAALHVQLGSFEAAEADYRALAELDAARGAALLGEFYFNTQRVDAAIQTWAEAAAGHPQDTQLPRALVKGLLYREATGDREKAAELLARLEAASPDEPSLLTLRALTLLRQRDPQLIDQAQGLLTRVVELQPTAVDAHVELVRIALARGEVEQARERVLAAQGTGSNHPTLLLARAQVELALGNLKPACHWAGLALQQNPEYTQAQELIIATAIDSADAELLKQARALVEKRLKADAANATWQVYAARLDAAAGQSADAIRALTQFCESQGNGVGYGPLLALADLHQRSGDPAGFQRWLARAIEVAPDARDVLNSQVAWLAQQHEFAQVRNRIDTYRVRPDADSDVIVRAAGVLAASGEPGLRRAAEGWLQDVLKREPGNVNAHLDLGLMAYRARQFEQAEQSYRAALAIAPANTRALNDLAWILAEQRRELPTALELANKAVQIEPRSANLRDTRAFVLLQMPDRLSDARADLQAMVDLLTPESAERARALLRLARVCAELKDFEAAGAALEQVQQIDERVRCLNEAERKAADELRRKSIGQTRQISAVQP